MIKLYTLFFYKLMQYVYSERDPLYRLGEWYGVTKAGILLIIFQISLIFNIRLIGEIMIGKKFLLSNNDKYFYLLLLLLISINYMSFAYNNRWKKYNDIFDNYSRNKNITINIFIVIAFLLNIGGALFITSAIWGKHIELGLIEGY